MAEVFIPREEAIAAVQGYFSRDSHCPMGLIDLREFRSHIIDLLAFHSLGKQWVNVPYWACQTLASSPNGSLCPGFMCLSNNNGLVSLVPFGYLKGGTLNLWGKSEQVFPSRLVQVDFKMHHLPRTLQNMGPVQPVLPGLSSAQVFL